MRELALGRVAVKTEKIKPEGPAPIVGGATNDTKTCPTLGAAAFGGLSVECQLHVIVEFGFASTGAEIPHAGDLRKYPIILRPPLRSPAFRLPGDFPSLV